MSTRAIWGLAVLVALVAFAFWAGKQIGAKGSGGQ